MIPSDAAALITPLNMHGFLRVTISDVVLFKSNQAHKAVDGNDADQSGPGKLVHCFQNAELLTSDVDQTGMNLIRARAAPRFCRPDYRHRSRPSPITRTSAGQLPLRVKTHRSGDSEGTAGEPLIAVGLVRRRERGIRAGT